MIRLLILSCGTNACYHIVKTLKSTFRNDFYIVGTDINNFWEVRSYHYLDKFIKCPKSTDSNYYQFVLSICKNERISFLLPSLDNDQILFYQDNSDLVELGVKSLGIYSSSLSWYPNKRDTFSRLDELGVPVPRIYESGVITSDAPYFIKPIVGYGSAGAHKFLDSDIGLMNSSYLVQEECFRPEVTLQCFNYYGDIYSVARERIESRDGICTKARVYHDQKLHDIVEHLSQCEKLPTLFNVQFMQNSRGCPVVTDLNLRPAGGMSMTVAAGFNEVVSLGKMMLGLPKEDVLQSVTGQIIETYVVRGFVDIVTKRVRKRIAFDLDGTLLDSRQRHIVVMQTVLDSMGVNVCADDLVSFKCSGANNLDWLLSKGIPNCLADEINRNWISLIEKKNFLIEDFLYDGVMENLKQLSINNDLFLVTARSNRDSLMWQLEKLDILHFFNKTYVVEPGADVASQKGEILKTIHADMYYGDTEVDETAALFARCEFYKVKGGFRN